MTTSNFSDRFFAGVFTSFCPPVGIYMQCKNIKKDIKHIEENRPDLKNDLKRTINGGKMESKEGQIADVALSIMNPGYGLFRAFSGGGLAGLFT